MDSFNRELSIYLLGSSEKSIAQKASKLINKCESAEFDITFPSASKLDIWTKCTNKSKNEISYEGPLRIEEDLHGLVLSEHLSWPVSSIMCKNDKVFLKFDRNFVMNSLIVQIITQGIIAKNRAISTSVCLVNTELERNTGKCSERQLGQLRTNQIVRSLERLLTFCNHKIEPIDKANHVLRIGCSDACHLRKHDDDIPLKVGQVKIKSNKNSKENYNLTEFYKSMCDKMLAIANERNFKSSEQDILKQTQIIAAAEIQMLLLSRNVDRSIILTNFEDNENAAKDASFVLYNYARISQLLESFDGQSERYGNIMPINQVDFTFLKEPEEWDILLNCIVPYLDTLATLSDINLTESRSHETLNRCLSQLCSHLLKLSNTYSKYYRRVKLLKEGIHGVLAVQTLNSRLYLIHVIKSVYDHAFKILGIKPIKYM